MPGAACLMLALAVAWPPELHPSSRGVIQALSAGLLMALVLGRARFVLPAWVPLLFPLAIGAILAAPCPARAIDEGAALLVLLTAGLLGRALGRNEAAVRMILLLVVVLGCMVSCLAVAQHHLLYPGQAAAIRAANPLEAGEILGRLEDGRPYGTFVLPAALGGFLALALPAAAGVAAAARRNGPRLLAAAALLLMGYGLFLTRSFGALAATAGGLACILPWAAPRRSRATAAALVLVAAIVAFWFLHARGAEFDHSAGQDPLTLRAGNWGAAVRMIVDHPILGTGPGSFGTVYPRYMRQGMNETRYVHNSYLQAAAGWGPWIILPLGFLAIAFGRSSRRAWREPGPRLAVVAAGFTFLLHNLVDFTAYLPGVAIPSALLVGLSLGDSPDDGGERAAPAAWRRGLPLLAAALAAILLFHGLVAARTDMYLDEAKEAARADDVARAAGQALAAAKSRPDDPGPQRFLAEMILAHGMEDPELRAAGEKAAERAVDLDPEVAIGHYTLALYHQAAGETAPAWRERYAAHLLYPLKPLYRDPPFSGREPRP